MSKTHDGGYLFFGDKSNNRSLNQYMSEPNYSEYDNSWVMKLDSNLNKQWDKTILTIQAFETIALETLDGCYAVASLSGAPAGGDKTHQPQSGARIDYFILKFCMDTVTGIDENTSDVINIVTYPNPFTASLQIAIASPQVTEATFTLTNTIGQVIYHSKETQLAAGYTKSLDLSYLPKGVYFIEVKAQQGGKVVKRVVKE
jgi:hypothetical protein